MPRYTAEYEWGEPDAGFEKLRHRGHNGRSKPPKRPSAERTTHISLPTVIRHFQNGSNAEIIRRFVKSDAPSRIKGALDLYSPSELKSALREYELGKTKLPKPFLSARGEVFGQISYDWLMTSGLDQATLTTPSTTASLLKRLNQPFYALSFILDDPHTQNPKVTNVILASLSPYYPRQQQLIGEAANYTRGVNGKRLLLMMPNGNPDIKSLTFENDGVDVIIPRGTPHMSTPEIHFREAPISQGLLSKITGATARDIISP